MRSRVSRHCERSEAIHLAAQRKNGLLRCARPGLLHASLPRHTSKTPATCQSAFKFDPGSASNFDPFGRRVLAVALAPSELAGVAETVRARAAWSSSRR